MKKSRIVMYVMLLVLIPATLLLGRVIPGRSWYLLSALVALEVVIPFFMAFEKRKPQARELVVVAVLSALAVVARVAIPLPHMKPIFAVVMLSGVAFGPETGFLVGAVGALGSDFFYGQGPFTPWQMMAYGLSGLAAGEAFAAGRLPKKNWVLGLFAYLELQFLTGPLLDTCTLFISVTDITWKTAWPIYLAGLPVNLSEGLTNLAVMMLFGSGILEKLDRVKTQYGMLEQYANGV